MHRTRHRTEQTPKTAAAKTGRGTRTRDRGSAAGRPAGGGPRDGGRQPDAGAARPAPPVRLPDDLMAAAKRLTGRVAALNPTAVIADLERLQRRPSRDQAIDTAQRLLREAGVAELSSLGTFPVRGRLRIEPGFHLGLHRGETPPAQAEEIEALTERLAEHGRQRFQRVEQRRDAMRFVEERPVKRAVILAPRLELLAGGELIIAQEISQLTIIADEIVYGDVLHIGYEAPDEAPEQPADLPRAADGDGVTSRLIHMPEPGSGGPPYQGRHGEDGDHGADAAEARAGDQLRLTPNLSIYVRHTPGGLPDIALPGRPGGEGQDGQDGGHGAEGARGGPSKSSLVECRYGPGHGGDGGRGGNGGRGADGGAGGTGGSVEIVTVEDNVELAESGRAAHIDIDGGQGGRGGVGGHAGSGGAGGEAGEAKGVWCRATPERRGQPGAHGTAGAPGDWGPRGTGGTFSVIPLTEAEWEAAVIRPWIVRFEPWETHAGEPVTLTGRHLSADMTVQVGARAVEPDWIDLEAERLGFTVPALAAGGQSLVRLRAPEPGGGFVLSDPLALRILPTLSSLTPAHAVPNNVLTLEGAGFHPESEVEIGGVRFQPDAGATSRQLTLTLPDHEHIELAAGTHELVVVNPDKGRSGALPFELSLEITVRIRAWRLQPDSWLSGGGGFGSSENPYPGRSADKIRDMFQGDVLEEVWGPQRIHFDFDPRVDDVVVPADVGINWPRGQSNPESNAILKAKDAAGNYLHYDPDAINFYFVNNIEEVDGGTTYAFVNMIGSFEKNKPGSWVIFADTIFGSDDEARIAAHELGHIFGLIHVCSDEAPLTSRFKRACLKSDKQYLMYTGAGKNPTKLNRKTVISDDEARDARILASVLHSGEGG